MKDAYTKANPTSAARSDVAALSMPGGNTRTTLHYSPFPLAFSSAAGSQLHSIDGRTYTDFLGDFTAGLYGHSNPLILDTIRRALDGGISFGGHNVFEARLSALMIDRFPSVDLVRFTNSGTEANLLALSTAAAATGRRKVMVFSGAYHGSVLTFATGGSPINVPYEFVVAEYNAVEETRTQLRLEGHSIAAVLVEPMLGSGGCIPATAEFLAMLREETSDAGALFVFDEVMTSRLAPGGLQELVGISPDLTTFGKYIGGGMSFGAFGGRRDLMENFDPTRPGSWPHAGTFNNNILSMAAGTVSLERIFTPEACAELNERGDRLRHSLNHAFEEAGVAMQATGLGSLMTIHATCGTITSRADLLGSNEKVQELLFFHLLADGFWLARRCMISLSLPVSDDDCSRLVTSVRLFLRRHRDILPTRD